MNEQQIRVSVETALSNRPVLDQVFGGPAISSNALRGILDEALVDGISSAELIAARSLTAQAANRYARTGDKADLRRYEAYASVSRAFDARATELVRGVANARDGVKDAYDKARDFFNQ